jgi:mannose-6-phosphate isomerase-like protein (cupin superfamily)
MRRGYALNAGEGRSYDWSGHFFTLKTAAAETGGRLAVWEFITKKGEEPNDHVHDDVDEIFCVLKGSLAVRCGGDDFEVSDGGLSTCPAA